MGKINAIAAQTTILIALTLLFAFFVAIIRIIQLCVSVPGITVKQLEITYLFEGCWHEGPLGVQSERRRGQDYDHH